MIATDGGWLQNVVNKAMTDPWQILAFIAQGLFATRFVLQMIASEKAKKVVVPVAFWWFSIVGTLGLLAYFCVKEEPVMILANSLNIGIYARNLVLHNRHLDAGAPSP